MDDAIPTGPSGGVLVVCTANVCRSPLAEGLLRPALAAAGVAVGSAGVRAAVGAGMCPVSAEELRAGDPVPSAHRARQVDRALIDAADLVVAMEREQRGALVREAPGSQAKVFTLREAVAFAEALRDRGAAPGSPAALAAAMHGLRGVVAPPAHPEPRRRRFRRAPEPADPLTIVDGHGQDDAGHRAAAAEVHEMAARFASAAAAVLGR